MATANDQQVGSQDDVKADLVALLSEMLAEQETDSRERAQAICDTLHALYGIQAAVTKVDRYNGLEHTREFGIVIPESSFDKLLNMLQRLFT